MAATGFTPISLYYSTTALAVPVNTNLVNGELAINITDGKLYYKDNAGVVQILATKAGASGDVVGPASSTTNAVPTFTNTTGKLIQNNSGVTIAAGVVTATGFSGPLNGTVGATTPTTGAFTQVDITAQGDLRLQDTTGGEYVALQAPGTLSSSYTLTMPVDDGNSGQVLTTDGTGVLSWTTNGAGDVVGPASSTTNAIPTFSDTTGKLIQNNSGVTISSGVVTATGFSGPLNGTVGATTPTTGVFTQVDITAQGDLRLQDTTGGEYVALQAPGTLASSYTLTLPVDDGTSGQALITDGSGVLSWTSITPGGGDVTGPASSTDNAVARFDGTTGKIIQNSAVTIADTTGDITGGAYNKVTITAPATSATLTIANGKTLTANNSLTLAGTDATTQTFPGTSQTIAGLAVSGQTFTTAQTFRAASAVRSEAAATQDAVVLAGRAGGTSSFAVTLTPTTLASSTTLTLPNVTDTVAVLGTAQTFTAAQTFRAASSVRAEAASTQDAVVLAGRAGGTSSYAVSITPTTLSANRTLTLPDASTTVVGTDTTQTLTNKRITPRVSTTTSSATPTINTDTTDIYGLTAQTVDITSFSTNLSGTPTDGQKLQIYIVGTAARAITWGASFEASTVALPTTTVGTNRLDVGFVWNAATSKWRCLASA